MTKFSVATLLILFAVLPSQVAAQEVSESVTPTTPVITSTPATTRASAAITKAAERKNAVLTQAATRRESAASKAAERKDKTEETRMENLRTRAVKEIDRRVKSMQELITRIANLNKLSDTQKTTLSTQVQSEITNLNALKAKIQADTDLATLQTDSKTIVASYRIYALFIPKIHIISAAESTLAASEKMMTAYTELQARVTAAKTAGADTTTMETALATMLAEINTAAAQANAAISTVTPLTPDGYPANKTSLNAARNQLKTARQDIQDARQQGYAVLRLLRSTGVTSISPSPFLNESPVTTISPTTP